MSIIYNRQVLKSCIKVSLSKIFLIKLRVWNGKKTKFKHNHFSYLFISPWALKAVTTAE